MVEAVTTAAELEEDEDEADDEEDDEEEAKGAAVPFKPTSGGKQIRKDANHTANIIIFALLDVISNLY